MKLGYINSSREEQNQVQQVLKMTSESVALDELGIGRIRDAFANQMFPGISTLQKHTKYFSLMPQLYREAAKKHYHSLTEVHAEIVRLERIMTKNLYEGSKVKWGITGSERIGKGTAGYVKYDPAYIYNSGLQIFEIIKGARPEELIYSASKAMYEAPEVFQSNDEDTLDDVVEKAGLFQFCSFPTVDYDFTKSCSLELTEADRDFIVGHILRAEACKDTLLSYLLEHNDMHLPHHFQQIDSQLLPSGLALLYVNACRFADFIYMVHVRYNYIFSNYEDEKLLEEFTLLQQAYVDSGIHIDEVLSQVYISDNSSKLFCKHVEHCLMGQQWKELDDLIASRERQVKTSRHKIGNPGYVYSADNRIHYYKLSYRWETVRQFMLEFRGEA